MVFIVPRNKAGYFLGETWHWGVYFLRFPFDVGNKPWLHSGKTNMT